MPVWKVASAEEKERIYPELLKKYNQIKNYLPEKQESLYKQYESAFDEYDKLEAKQK
jgi:hypothetical protein